MNYHTLSLFGYNPFGYDGEDNTTSEPEFDLAKLLANPKAKAALVDWAEREIVKPVKDKNSELLDKLTKYKTKVEKDGKTEEVYLDPEEAKEAIARAKANGDMDLATEIQRALAAQQERHQAEIDGIKGRAKDFESKFSEERDARHKLMIGNTLRNALVDSQIKTTKMHLHEKYLKDFIRIDNSEGSERIVVVDDAGKIRYGVMGLMTVAEYITEYKEKDGIAEDWHPTVKTGTGTAPSGSRIGNVTIPDNMSPSERLKVLRRAQAAGAR